MTYIGEEFQKRFKTLPEDIQNALTAVASVETLTAIGKKHGLMVDQIGKMADEIWKVMLGLANPKDFIRNLASALGIESEKASAIASEVNAQMFQPVRESLRRLYDQVPATSPPVDRAGFQQPASSKAEQKIDTEIKELQAGSRKSEATPAVPPMIYPQDRFEEPFKKEPAKEDGASSMYHVAREKEEKKEAPASPEQERGEPEQIAPLVPSVLLREQSRGGVEESPSMIPQPPPSTPPPQKKEDFIYPEKMKEVSREPAASQGGYKSRDPYRELVE